MMTAKITDRHLSRMACVYIRQSTVAQVRFNQESTERQYNLASKAQLSAGERSRFVSSIATSANRARTTHREDFKSLVSDVAMGNVGAIFSLEASRLARSNQDWHRLLELCAITNTLVIDEDGCYDPAEFNDGLVLGMKGTFAQAELHIIRSRLHGGKLNKASKGELRFPLPVGFVYDEDKIVLDPDQEVQGAVRTVFELFETEGTAYAVVHRFHELGLRFPRRSYGGAWDGKLLWGRLTHSRVLGLLTNPSYAGRYVFGRYQSRKHIAPTGEISTISRPVPQDQWRVTIPDHHPGYITWDRFLANRHRLATNQTNREVLADRHERDFACCRACFCAAAAAGKLTLRYTGNGGIYPTYQCNWRIARHWRACLHPVPARRSTRDCRTVGLRRHAGDYRACTRGTDEPGGARPDIGAQWRRRIERAHYEADLAERRYEASIPPTG